MKHVRVDPRSERHRLPDLDKSMPHIKRALDAGQGVSLHCMQSFHRAPVAAAAAYTRVTGAIATVYAFLIRSLVAATSQIKYFSV